MTPDTRTVIDLVELNKTIAQQKGVTVADLALKDPSGKPAAPVVEAADPVEAYVDPAPAPVQAAAQDGVLTDEQLASQYRSQADAMFKEAKVLREQAKEITDRLKNASEE